jgi:hypothetical protein
VISSDLLRALLPVVEALDALGVRHYVGGSVASSLHGLPRASVDVDLVADLQPEHVRPLFERLTLTHYVSEERVRDAVRRRRSFNLIHLDTMLKVDVFVQKGRPFDLEALARAREAEPPAGGGRSFRVASAEDVALSKLAWYREGGEVSERQWTDVVGVLRAGTSTLEETYLRKWAAVLSVGDLLDRAMRDAGWPAD